MSWEPELEELKRREAFAEELGGAERVKRQKDGGRLDDRERVEQMADSDPSANSVKSRVLRNMTTTTTSKS